MRVATAVLVLGFAFLIGALVQTVVPIHVTTAFAGRVTAVGRQATWRRRRRVPTEPLHEVDDACCSMSQQDGWTSSSPTATRRDDSSQALADAIRVERMALDAGPNADRNLGALAREIRRTQLSVTKIENRL